MYIYILNSFLKQKQYITTFQSMHHFRTLLESMIWLCCHSEMFILYYVFTY